LHNNNYNKNNNYNVRARGEKFFKSPGKRLRKTIKNSRGKESINGFRNSRHRSSSIDNASRASTPTAQH